MENLTKPSEISFTFKPEVWMTDIAICSIFTLVSLHILAALLYYSIKAKSFKKHGVLLLPCMTAPITIALFLGKAINFLCFDVLPVKMQRDVILKFFY